MAKNKTFAEIVAEVEREPSLPPNVCSDGVLAAPDGRIFERLNDDLSTTRANELIGSGAAVAIDDCGCSGYCAIGWAEKSSVTSVPPIKKKSWGTLEEWRSRDGSVMVLLSGPGFKHPSR